MDFLIRKWLGDLLAKKTMHSSRSSGEFTSQTPRSNSPVTQGALYGLGIWSASRIAALPFNGPKATIKNMITPRSLMSLAAHMATGATVGFAGEKFKKLKGHLASPHENDRPHEASLH